ncbi:MAG: hypothetical protein IPG89_12530 [Bacteroidetes bacterium]|nr:hypothetical protein [Bacteroidota bacterium]
MELLFVYIENYNNIKKKGYCLSSKHEITYDIEEHKLTITDYSFNLTKYFQSNISDIKAIIGANGAGKTSLLHFLFHESSGEDFSKVNKQDFMVCLKNDVIYISSPKSKPLKKEDIINKTQKKIVLIPTEDKLIYKKLEPFKGSGLIYFSSIFDNNYIGSTNTYAQNISTNYLIRADKRFVFFEGEGYPQVIEQTECHRTQELIRQIEFLEESTVKFDFKLPQQIRINIKSIDEKNFFKSIG